MRRRTVIFDFDGTIVLGRGPLDAYARCLGEVAGEDITALCLATIEQFEAGETAFSDAYDAVQAAAISQDVSRDQLSAAYLRSRKLLATDAAPVYPPAGLDVFMRKLSDSATCVVVTNAPETGVDRALTQLGIADLVTEVHVDVGKPAGLEPILSAYLAHGAVLAVGDRWDNDLAPAIRVGADTALVGTGHAAGDPTMRGETLTDIYDEILDWAAREGSLTPAATPAATPASSSSSASTPSAHRPTPATTDERYV